MSRRLKLKSKKALQPLEGPDKDVGKNQKKKEEKSTKATIAAKSEQVGDVQENSTVKPPYVMKHKMNKVNDQKEMDDIYFLGKGTI